MCVSIGSQDHMSLHSCTAAAAPDILDCMFAAVFRIEKKVRHRSSLEEVQLRGGTNSRSVTPEQGLEGIDFFPAAPNQEV